MKKTIYILLMIVYLLPTVGLTIAYHFCGDTLVSTTIASGDSKKESADCCGEESTNDSCCHTQIKSYKLDDLHFASAKIEIKELVPDDLILPVEIIDNQFLSEKVSYSKLQIHSPPGEYTYLKNRTLLI